MDPSSLFSLSDHLERLSKDGDPLEVMDATVDFEYFRGWLVDGLGYSDGFRGGRPPFDPVSTFKVPILQARHNLSDAKMEFMIRRQMRHEPKLGIARRCELLRLSRSAFYYKPCGVSEPTLSLMKAMDRIFTQHPFFGSRQLQAYLRREEGIAVGGGRRVRRLMRLMGLEAVYSRPRTTAPHPAHPVYPYLLKNLRIDRPNQVWCADITFIPAQRGYLYLVAIMDWATRKVLSWRLVKYHARKLLRRSVGGSFGNLRTTRDHEYGSRQSVHGFGVDRHFDQGRRQSVHGWARALHEQYLH